MYSVCDGARALASWGRGIVFNEFLALVFWIERLDSHEPSTVFVEIHLGVRLVCLFETRIQVLKPVD